jgi:phytoene dehydrogenase-like protein
LLRSVNRRDVLKTGALATTGALLSQVEPAEAAATRLIADYVVVGGGYGGVSAAWELHKHRKRVIVLEANSRVGGRVWTSQLSDGTPFEIGGQWVSDHNAQPDVRDLMGEFGIVPYKMFDEGLNVFVGSDGSVATYNANDPDPAQVLPPISLAGKLELDAFVLSLGEMASVVDRNAPWDDVDFPPGLPVLGPAAVRFNSPVRTIAEDATGVTVSTDNLSVRAPGDRRQPDAPG